MNDIREAQRKQLEDDLIRAGLALFEFSGSMALCVYIPKTAPPVFIFAGTKQDIKYLANLTDANDNSRAIDAEIAESGRKP